MVERQLSSIPMTVPQTGTIHKQTKNMDTGANQAQAQAQLQPLIQTQIPHQPQTSPPLRRLPDPTIPSSTPFIPQPQGTIQSTARISVDTGTRPKTNVVVTPAAWREPVRN